LCNVAVMCTSYCSTALDGSSVCQVYNLHSCCILTFFGPSCCSLSAMPRSTQRSTLHSIVKWVSAFGLSNNNKWRWWMWMVAANHQWPHSPSWLAWSECWRPLGAQSAFIKWTRWFSCNGFSYDDSTMIILVIIISRWLPTMMLDTGAALNCSQTVQWGH